MDKNAATAAALDWVGAYEGNDSTGTSYTILAAFELLGDAKAVKAEFDFPPDMVDAYVMLERMCQSQERAATKPLSEYVLDGGDGSQYRVKGRTKRDAERTLAKHLRSNTAKA